MKKPYRPIRLALWLLVLCMLTAGALLGKYVTTKDATESVIFTAELAKDLYVEESENVRDPDGDYFGPNTYIKNNQNFELVPGLDFYKDPRVVIKGKSDIPAYLFLEVVEVVQDANSEGNKNAVSYQVDPTHWTVVKPTVWTPAEEGVRTGRTVYQYKNGSGDPAVLKKAEADIVVPILAGNTVYVSQHLKTMDRTTALEFHASLEEVAAHESP